MSLTTTNVNYNLEKVVPLSPHDVSTINNKILPRHRKFILTLFVFCSVFAVIIAYILSNYADFTLIPHSNYNSSLLVILPGYCVALARIIYGYFKLKEEASEGVKSIFRAPVQRIEWQDQSRFELILEDKPSVIKKKLWHPKGDSALWNEGDLVEINYLGRSGEVIEYHRVP